MNHTELIKNAIYRDSGDPDVPLQFTGKKRWYILWVWSLPYVHSFL